MTSEIVDTLLTTARGVFAAVGPLVVLFLVFQVFLLDLPRSDVRRILVGTAAAAAGLFLFLLGVGIGFLPFGRLIGEALATMPAQWLLGIFGAVLGFVTAFSEPAVRILADEVDTASNGAIPPRLVIYTICIGVAVWVGLGLLRIAYEIPLTWLLVPGYSIVIVLFWLCDKDFVSIAIDAGGVTTGPMANTFLLALALGLAAATGDRDPLLYGLGLVALIALAPIMSLVALGSLVRRKTRTKRSKEDAEYIAHREHSA
ncbi:MAG TPA: DUF1538 domain-containing protein [Woeseiaceae bacterium]|nr:DUF1538 domain-containing protein [Woeseiaceae bacterium]